MATQKQLVTIAREFNDVMALEPPIAATTKTKVANLERDIRDASDQLRDSDEFSPEVEALLVDLGYREPEEEESEEGEEEEAPQEDTGEWLKGCEICNVGLINEIDERYSEGEDSINKICKNMVKAIEDQFGVSPYTANALKQRYLYHKNMKDPDEKKKGKGAGGGDGFSSTINAMKKTVNLLNEIPKTKKFKGSKEGKNFIDSIRQYALGIMVGFHQLGIDPVKEIEEWQKSGSK